MQPRRAVPGSADERGRPAAHWRARRSGPGRRLGGWSVDPSGRHTRRRTAQTTKRARTQGRRRCPAERVNESAVKPARAAQGRSPGCPSSKSMSRPRNAGTPHPGGSRTESLRPVLSVLVHRSAQLLVDRRRKLRKSNRECPQEAKAPRKHHVAVRNRKMRTEAGAVEEAAARPRDGQPFRRTGIQAKLQRTMPHVVEDRLVGKRAGRDPVEVLL